VTLTNLGEAALLCPKDAGGRDGAVFLTVHGAKDHEMPLPNTLGRFEQAVIEFDLAESQVTAVVEMELGLAAKNRASFGSKFKVNVAP
jgi:hypothetical protein